MPLSALAARPLSLSVSSRPAPAPAALAHSHSQRRLRGEQVVAKAKPSEEGRTKSSQSKTQSSKESKTTSSREAKTTSSRTLSSKTKTLSSAAAAREAKTLSSRTSSREEEEEKPEPKPLIDEQLIADVKAKVEFLVSRPQLLAVSGGAALGLWLSVAIVGAIHDVPVLPKALELAGLGYIAWFVYAYVLQGAGREQLSKDVEALKEKVLGDA